ncbi:unnamed protein product [Protopolystoma xenopodis]|uniref:Uncharacterized protein n=1 Tax=Protopolystoma xenopodis TaxID=117903 RepID=A0A3S5B0L1_9PLAT|nr:unnamed protein product [Protopolystoma xenopodis]
MCADLERRVGDQVARRESLARSLLMRKRVQPSARTRVAASRSAGKEERTPANRWISMLPLDVSLSPRRGGADRVIQPDASRIRSLGRSTDVADVATPIGLTVIASVSYVTPPLLTPVAAITRTASRARDGPTDGQSDACTNQNAEMHRRTVWTNRIPAFAFVRPGDRGWSQDFCLRAYVCPLFGLFVYPHRGRGRRDLLRVRLSVKFEWLNEWEKVGSRPRGLGEKCVGGAKSSCGDTRRRGQIQLAINEQALLRATDSGLGYLLQEIFDLAPKSLD